MCGVIAWLGIVRQGWSLGGGCGNQTSPAYPASWPLSSARTMASRSQILPRAVFTMYDPRFILPMSASLNMCSVSGCRGQWMLTTSQTLTSDSTVSWNVRPSSCSTSAESRCLSV